MGETTMCSNARPAFCRPHAALCLLVLIVIVIAGGKLSFQATKTGVSANVGKDVEQAAALAADATADAAALKAEEIKASPPTGFTPPPGEQL